MMFSLKNWSVQRKLGLLLLAFFLSFALFVWVSHSTLNTVKVNGKYYHNLKEERELSDDVSPSKVNLNPSYLTILRMLEETNAAHLQEEINVYHDYHDKFESRYNFWESKLPDGAIKQALTQSAPPAQEFYRIVDEQFIPAILSGDKDKARTLLNGRLSQLFLDNQNKVKEAIKLSEAQHDATEQKVNQIIDDNTTKLIVIGLGLGVGVVGGLGYFISRSVTGELQGTVNTLSVTSAEMAATVEQQERSAIHQASAIHETTATMDELDASFNQTAKIVQTAVDTAHQARNVADDGIRTVQQSLDGMNSLKQKVTAVAEQILNLSEHTNQIATITNLVSDLANQTNMLALNAAVESARAGEHGKGFGVIATEIRKLADESKKSAERISTLVSDIQAATNSTVMATEEGTKTVEQSIHLAQDTADAFHEVVRTSSMAADTAEQTLLTIPQQVMAVKQVLSAMESLNSNAKESASSIGQTRVGMDSLRDATVKLKGMI